ncbi:MAG: DUF2199 domain-containing protein [Pseudomonadota bacterium]
MFGRRKRSEALEWLSGKPWHCAGCGVVHDEMFALACTAPDAWQGPVEYAPNGAIEPGGDFLSEDFCMLRGEHFFIRCSVEIPVHGLAGKFSFGVWSTLSRANFAKYLDGFDNGDYPDFGPWFGWFSNDLRLFGTTLNQKCQVHPQRERHRPVLSMIDSGHPLAIAQAEGVSPEQAMGFYAYYGCTPVTR